MPLYPPSVTQAPTDLPTGAIAETYPRYAGLALTSIVTSGTLRLSWGIRIPANRQVTSISVFSGSTALSVGTNQWFGLFDGSYNKLALTTDDTSTAWAANAVKTLNLSAPYTPTADILVYVGVLVAATTPPTFVTPATGAFAHLLQAPAVGGNSTAALTNPASCPTTVASISVANPPVYAWIS